MPSPNLQKQNGKKSLSPGKEAHQWGILHFRPTTLSYFGAKLQKHRVHRAVYGDRDLIADAITFGSKQICPQAQRQIDSKVGANHLFSPSSLFIHWFSLTRLLLHHVEPASSSPRPTRPCTVYTISIGQAGATVTSGRACACVIMVPLRFSFASISRQ